MVPRRILSSETIQALSQRTISGSFPILLDFQHEDIVWSKNTNMENGHIRVINSPVAVWYQGDEDEVKYYAPCSFSAKFPEEDGKTIGDITVSVGFTDQSFVNVIRSVSDQISCKIVAMYQCTKNENSKTVYSFIPLKNYVMEVDSVTWSQSIASFKLVRDSIQNLKIPRDMADDLRFPGIIEEQ